ncbi:hypothetical protein BRD14_02130 [Halobacteriales archaeon SW_5_68_122]|nr:MAG: hypothetical protein BRD14_02130 [Halobacteriales archaeon SW_5_68_122]
MGLKCSLLGHSFEPADRKREREEQGSEVVTVHREIERCVRCGEERVVSESTEVTAVVDEEELDLGDDGRTGPGDGPDTAVDGVVGHGGAGDAGETLDSDEYEARDPAEEDTEILTDDEPERELGAWPDDPEGSWDPDETPTSGRSADASNVDAGVDEDPVRPDEETLSGITVPEGEIVCTECAFSVDADSAYRDGDPCPDCGAWLTSERNR